MIRFDNISKRYPGGFEALSRVSFHLPRGKLAYLTGHSGAGKSTLLKLIALIERPSRGQIILDGINLNNIRNRRIPQIRRNIGIIFQNHHLLYDRPVFDNVAMPLVIQGYRHREISKRVRVFHREATAPHRGAHHGAIDAAAFLVCPYDEINRMVRGDVVVV